MSCVKIIWVRMACYIIILNWLNAEDMCLYNFFEHFSTKRIGQKKMQKIDAIENFPGLFMYSAELLMKMYMIYINCTVYIYYAYIFYVLMSYCDLQVSLHLLFYTNSYNIRNAKDYS